MRFRRDNNERDIVRALEMAGAEVWRIEKARPAGFPDLAVLFRHDWFLLEVKTTTGRLSEEQQDLLLRGAVQLVRNPIEALQAIGATQ